MARIRSIKPEFWKSEQVAEVSRAARLLFIGMLNEADDKGNGVASPAYLKAALFPYDDDLTKVEVSVFMSELWVAGLIGIYVCDGRTYYHVHNFLKHQKISKPQPAKYPEPESFLERSGNAPGILQEHSVLIGGDRRGLDRMGVEGIARGASARPSNPEQETEPFEDAPQSTQNVKTSEGSGHTENTPQRGAVFDEHSVAECISTVMRTIGGVGSYDSIYVTGTHRQYVHDVVRYFRSEAEHVGDTPRQLCCESVAHYLESDFVQDMKKTGRVSMTAWFKDPASNAPWSTSTKPKQLTPEEYHRANG